MNICGLINELETIKDQYGKDVEVVIQDRINVEGADPYLNLTYSKEREFVTYNSGNYYVEKVLLL